MNYHSNSRNSSSLLSRLLTCAFTIGLIYCLTGCSESEDYEIFAKIQGVVTDYQTGIPLRNASVTLLPSGLSKQTDVDGFYEFDELDVQQYTITVQKSGYQPNRKTITAISGKVQKVDVQLTVIPQ